MDPSLQASYDFSEFDLNLINEFSLDNTDLNLLSHNQQQTHLLQNHYNHSIDKPTHFLQPETPNTQQINDPFQYPQHQHSPTQPAQSFIDPEGYQHDQQYQATSLAFSTSLNANVMPSPHFASTQRNHQQQLPTPSSSGQLMGSNDCAFMSPFAFFDHTGAVVDEGLDEDEMLFTPLVSPAMTPSHPYSNSLSASLVSEVFSPLTSPALGPNQAKFPRSFNSIPNLSLGGSLMQSMIQAPPSRSKSLLSANEDVRVSEKLIPSKTSSKVKTTVSRAVSQRKRPYPERRFSATPSSLSTSTTLHSGSIETEKSNDESVVSPITPASLMKLGGNKITRKASFAMSKASPVLHPFTSPSLCPSLMMSPTICATPTSPALSSTFKSPSLKPMISPNLKPLLPGGGTNDVAMKLATKSNYQNILEGNTTSLGLKYNTDIHSGIELRRTSHKAAEQKRRDSLKQCFENLRSVIPEIEEKAPSKAYLLKKSYDHILTLESQVQERDKYIDMLREQLQSNGVAPIQLEMTDKMDREDSYQCLSMSPISSLESSDMPFAANASTVK
ncbi:hypothetical protein K7432_003910 [Basidiobolus ranarum]|uniref:BHLH domain-containing protein n=1 Tax=Basidiobolus ranarum TaxID=34480 RepID=A0ABR2WZ30_9FUNG